MRDTGLFFAYLSSSKQEEINLSQRLAFRIAIWWFVVDSDKPGEILWGHKKALLIAVELKYKLNAEIGREGALTRLSKDKCVFVWLSLGFKIQLIAYSRCTLESCHNNLDMFIMLCLEETLETSCDP